MEIQGSLILDISSDEETGFADVRKSAGGEFINSEDVERFSSLLVDDDSDDVVLESEVLAKTPKESTSESLKPLPNKVVDDDDDCVVLDGDPDKSIVAVTNKVDDDDVDLKIVGEKGEVACRDFPHSRHHCANYPFASTPHDVHCGQCYCYVCESLAPCSNWGTGANDIDHCHACDKEEYWKTERKHAKKGDNPKSDNHSKGAPAQSNSLPDNQALNPVTVRPCALSSNVAPRYNPRSQSVPPPQGAVSGIPLLDPWSPRNMDYGCANYLLSVPHLNSQPYSSYGILGSSLPYYVPSNPPSSRTVPSYQWDAGNAPSTISTTRSSPGRDSADSGSSKLQCHCKMQHPSGEEILPPQRVELAAAASTQKRKKGKKKKKKVAAADCQIPEIREVCS